MESFVFSICDHKNLSVLIVISDILFSPTDIFHLILTSSHGLGLTILTHSSVKKQFITLRKLL